MGTCTKRFGRLTGVGAVCGVALLFGGAGQAFADAPRSGKMTATAPSESGRPAAASSTSDNDNVHVRKFSPPASAMNAVARAASILRPA